MEDAPPAMETVEMGEVFDEKNPVGDDFDIDREIFGAFEPCQCEQAGDPISIQEQLQIHLDTLKVVWQKASEELAGNMQVNRYLKSMGKNLGELQLDVQRISENS